jgi:hypothetical protein
MDEEVIAYAGLQSEREREREREVQLPSIYRHVVSTYIEYIQTRS